MSRGKNKLKVFNCEECPNTIELGRRPNKGKIIRCRTCKNKYLYKKNRATGYHKNPEYKLKAKEWRLKHYYNLSIEDFNNLLELQGNVCAICKKESNDLVVDHCHTTNKVRGILCQHCNRALGMLQDDLTIIHDSAAYLFRHNSNRSWDLYFIEMARLASLRSKDPSTQVGSVIVKDKQQLSTGYNGLPRNVNDDKIERYKRPLKYSWMVHGEENAILNAARQGISCNGATLYVTPIYPCSRCAAAIVQAGIIKVVVDEKYNNPRYAEDKKIAEDIMKTAGVEIINAISRT